MDNFHEIDYTDIGLKKIGIGVLGYGFMSLATLFVAFTFTDGKLQRWIHYLFIVNGISVFPILLQIYWPELVYIAGLWTITFIVPIVLLAVLFRKALQTNSQES